MVGELTRNAESRNDLLGMIGAVQRRTVDLHPVGNGGVVAAEQYVAAPVVTRGVAVAHRVAECHQHVVIRPRKTVVPHDSEVGTRHVEPLDGVVGTAWASDHFDRLGPAGQHRQSTVGGAGDPRQRVGEGAGTGGSTAERSGQRAERTRHRSGGTTSSRTARSTDRRRRRCCGNRRGNRDDAYRQHRRHGVFITHVQPL